MHRPRRGPGTAMLAAVILVGAALLARRWLDVVEVRGDSMRPALQPGDRLLVERLSFRRRAPRPGEVVLAPDPRSASRELVKRVSAVKDGRVVTVSGDAPQRSTDSRAFGPLPREVVRWRAALRYWPPARVGRIADVRAPRMTVA